MFDTRGLVKLGRLSGEDLDISSWWISLAKKIAVSGRINLVTYMNTDATRVMKPKTLGMKSLFLYLSCIILLRLSPEMRRLAYSGIRWEDYEGTL